MCAFKRWGEQPLAKRLAVKVIAGMIGGVLLLLVGLALLLGSFELWLWGLSWATDDPALALLLAVIFAPATTACVAGGVYYCVSDELDDEADDEEADAHISK